ncbi:MAG: hypothetical protein ACK4NY_09445 [Spirosomataceae bacterium]
MNYLRNLISIATVNFCNSLCFGHNSDTTKNTSTFLGVVGITNNGFSIVPSFTLNSPVIIFNGALRKNSYSFETDLKLAVDAKNGGLIWWFRYQLVQKKKFGLRTGVHPALSIIKRAFTENGPTAEISELLRFAGFEVFLMKIHYLVYRLLLIKLLNQMFAATKNLCGTQTLDYNFKRYLNKINNH